jgi:hypothetical protein
MSFQEIKKESTQSQFMTNRSIVQSTVLTCGLVVMLVFQGCIVGPSLYQASFDDYNDAIRKTADGQMLANLVRMRYYESPVFLQVASVSTNFTVSGSAGASATLNESASNNYGLNAGGGYSESPTITFSLPESREYYGRLMAPLSANQITMLIEAGFDSEMIMRTAVRRINRLENLKIDYSSYPRAPRSYSEFCEVFTLLKKLSFEGLAEFGPGLGTSVWSTPVAVINHGNLSDVALLATGVLAQYTAGGELLQNENKEWQLHTFSRRLSIRFSPDAINSPDAQRLRELLNLDPDRSSFPILDLELTGIEKGRAYAGQSPAALDPKAIWPEIGLQGRSMMEIMQISSTDVQIPDAHIKEGFAFVDSSPTRDRDDVLFVIKSSKDEPSAILRIKYRDYWFYIEDNDLESREAFALIDALFAVTGGTVPGANPILTLPVN